MHEPKDEPHPREDLIVGHETAAGVGHLVVASLREIEAALGPVVGSRGVSALFARSVHLAGQRHRWLGDSGSAQTLDLAALEQRIAAQGVADAAAGGSDLLRTFRELFASLVGTSLTQKLLEPAWSRFSGGTDPKGGS